MDLSVEFAQIIKRLREKYGLSQEAMAFKCNMHSEHIGKIERSEITPSFETISKIANAFSMSIAAFLSLNDKFFETPEESANPVIMKIVDILKRMSDEEQTQILKIVQTFMK